MVFSSSSLSLVWSAKVKQAVAAVVDASVLREAFLRIITESFGIERDSIQTVHLNDNNDSSSSINSASSSNSSINEVFMFPGGFVLFTSSHLFVRLTTNPYSVSSVPAVFSGSLVTLISQTSNAFCCLSEDEHPPQQQAQQAHQQQQQQTQQQLQRNCLGEVITALAYVSFGSLDSDLYIYLASSLMDVQWFTNTFSPQLSFPNVNGSSNRRAPITVSGFVFGSFSETAATPSLSSTNHFSLSEGFFFLPPQPPQQPLLLPSAASTAAAAAASAAANIYDECCFTPSTPFGLEASSSASSFSVPSASPFNTVSGQLTRTKTKSGSFVFNFFEAGRGGETSAAFGTSAAAAASAPERFMRLTSFSFAKPDVASVINDDLLRQRKQTAGGIPECILVDILPVVAELPESPKNSNVLADAGSDFVTVKSVSLVGSTGYKIAIKHLKQTTTAAVAFPQPSILAAPLSSPSAAVAAAPAFISNICNNNSTNNNNNIINSSSNKRCQVNNRLTATAQRTTSKQTLASYLNQLQENRRSKGILSNSVLPEVQIIHGSKSSLSEYSPVVGLAEVYQEEADVLRRYINHLKPDRSIMLINLQKIIDQWHRWRQNLPRVQPFYAVKCNGDVAILQTLANLGCNFDCASQTEIDLILKTLQLSPDRIIYSNPCKQHYGIRCAKQRRVRLTVADNMDELVKLSKIYPECELLLRISTDDSGSQCPLSCKFGASSSSWAALLDKAKELSLTVKGVHLHVGSGCSQLGIFTKALHDAREVFDLGIQRGFKMTILNIGGGFPGNIKSSSPSSSSSSPIAATATAVTATAVTSLSSLSLPSPPATLRVSFEDLCNEINPLLNSLFPAAAAAAATATATAGADEASAAEGGYRIIAEPGRYFAASSCCLATKVYSRRIPVCSRSSSSSSSNDVSSSSSSKQNYLYYVNDGVYGSFNNLIYDHADVNPRVLMQSNSNDTNSNTSSSSSGSSSSNSRRSNSSSSSSSKSNSSNSGTKISHTTTITNNNSSCLGLNANRSTDSNVADNDGSSGGQDRIEKSSNSVGVTTTVTEAASSPFSPLLTMESAIFGQTCDGFDCIKRRIALPKLEVGDWLMFEEMGAYTISAASTFNGFQPATRLHVRILPIAAAAAAAATSAAATSAAAAAAITVTATATHTTEHQKQNIIRAAAAADYNDRCCFSKVESVIPAKTQTTVQLIAAAAAAAAVQQPPYCHQIHSSSALLSSSLSATYGKNSVGSSKGCNSNNNDKTQTCLSNYYCGKAFPIGTVTAAAPAAEAVNRDTMINMLVKQKRGQTARDSRSSSHSNSNGGSNNNRQLAGGPHCIYSLDDSRDDTNINNNNCVKSSSHQPPPLIPSSSSSSSSSSASSSSSSSPSLLISSSLSSSSSSSPLPSYNSCCNTCCHNVYGTATNTTTTSTNNNNNNNNQQQQQLAVASHTNSSATAATAAAAAGNSSCSYANLAITTGSNIDDDNNNGSSTSSSSSSCTTVNQSSCYHSCDYHHLHHQLNSSSGGGVGVVSGNGGSGNGSTAINVGSCGTVVFFIDSNGKIQLQQQEHQHEQQQQQQQQQQKPRVSFRPLSVRPVQSTQQNTLYPRIGKVNPRIIGTLLRSAYCNNKQRGVGAAAAPSFPSIFITASGMVDDDDDNHSSNATNFATAADCCHSITAMPTATATTSSSSLSSHRHSHNHNRYNELPTAAAGTATAASTAAVVPLASVVEA